MNCAVYIMTNVAKTLYIGVTSNLEQRVYQHQHGLIEGFTKKYGLHQLVYFEQTEDIRVAIEREKQLKGWRRARKIELIETANPNWEDLAARWFPKPLSS